MLLANQCHKLEVAVRYIIMHVSAICIIILKQTEKVETIHWLIKQSMALIICLKQIARRAVSVSIFCILLKFCLRLMI